MKLTPKKLSETWQITDGHNKAQFTVHSDFTFEVLRIRIYDEKFIDEAKKTLTNMIQL